MSGDLLVITSCTASKLDTPEGVQHPAESLYTGQQHLRLMRGVNAYRTARQPAGPLRFRILSAQHGLLAPKTRIASYDHTFSGRRVAAIRRAAREKTIPSAVRDALRKPFAGGLLLLGDTYLRACDLDEDLALGGPVLSFCSPASARRMPRIAGLRTIPLANAEAKRFSVGLTALKGELGRRMLTRLAEDPGALPELMAPTSAVLARLYGRQAAVRGNPSRRAA